MKLDRNFFSLIGLGFKFPGMGFVPMGVLFGLSQFARNFKIFTTVYTGRLLVTIAFWAVISGLLVRLFASERELDSLGLMAVVTTAIWVAMMVLVAITIIIPVQRIGLEKSFVLVGAGMAIGTYLLVRPEKYEWKYALGYGVVILGLGIAARRTLPVSIIAGIGFIFFSFSQGARSIGIIVAFSIAAAVLASVRGSSQRENRIGPGIVFGSALTFSGLVAAIIYAMKTGWLGEKLQASYIEQTAGGQFILIGGRTEWRASWDLFLANPWGYGLGGQPSGDQKRSAIAAATEFRGSYFDPYFTKSVFGTRVDLHSAFCNLWFHFGIGGLLLALTILVILVRGVLRALHLSPVMVAPAVFILAFGIWDLLFSPMRQYDHIGLAIGIAVLLELLVRKQNGGASTKLSEVGRPDCATDNRVDSKLDAVSLITRV
jgi:hypothetical protein